MKKIYFLLLFLPALSTAQIITTVAGNDTAGYSGDGGPATAAQLNGPGEIAIDGTGNIYIADWHNQRVRKVNTAGIISTFAGLGTIGFSGDGGPATGCEFHDPIGVAVDAIGNVYVSDNGNQRIRKVNTSGIVSTFAGNGIMGWFGDGGPATAAYLYGPQRIAVDATGNLYVAEQYNECIRKINTLGIITTIAGNGLPGYGGDGGPATAAYLHWPTSVAVDSLGNVFIADYVNHRIRRVDLSGTITTFAGNGAYSYSGDGGPATAAAMKYPNGIAVGSADNLWIADGVNYRLRKVDPSGIISTIVGNGIMGHIPDGCSDTSSGVYANGVALDGSGNVYIIDGSSIRKISNNYSPIFINGHIQSLSVCENDSVQSVDTLLAIFDSDLNQDETWSVLSSATHGTVIAFYSNVSTGGTTIPTGLSYMPNTGYSGNDTFTVLVTDCGIGKDTTTIVVTVVNCTLNTNDINKPVNNTVYVYPSPAYSLITVVSQSKIKNISIMDIVGQTTYRQSYDSAKVQVDISNLPIGIYFIKVNGAVVGKFVKK
jgi:sugar lactone lactonase YvrE